MEFMLFSGIAMITAVIFISISVNQIKNLKDTEEYLLLEDIALKIQNEVSIASYAEDGYERNFKLPNNVNSKPYNFILVNNSLVVWTNTTPYTLSIINITGYFKKGVNTITKTSGRINVN